MYYDIYLSLYLYVKYGNIMKWWEVMGVTFGSSKSMQIHPNPRVVPVSGTEVDSPSLAGELTDKYLF